MFRLPERANLWYASCCERLVIHALSARLLCKFGNLSLPRTLISLELFNVFTLPSNGMKVRMERSEERGYGEILNLFATCEDVRCFPF